MDGQFKARDIKESPTFVEQKAKIEPDCKRLDEQLRGVFWALARKPESFTRHGNTGLFGVKTDSWPEAPSVIIWYKFNENQVELLGIEIAEMPDEHERTK